jgi:hypothetical protein
VGSCVKLREEKILLELEGLRRSRVDSLKITAQLNDALIKLLSEKIRREEGELSRDELVKRLRELTMRSFR